MVSVDEDKWKSDVVDMWRPQPRNRCQDRLVQVSDEGGGAPVDVEDRARRSPATQPQGQLLIEVAVVQGAVPADAHGVPTHQALQTRRAAQRS